MRPARLVSVSLRLFLALATAGTALAQSPFAGTWKINPELSQMAGDTVTFGPAAEDSIEYTAGAIKYSFRADGKNYRMPSGDLAVWRETGEQAWTTEYRKPDGKLLSTDTWKVSEDGKTLTVTSSGVRPNGDLYTDTEIYDRIKSNNGGASGLLGSWKGSSVKNSSPSVMVIQEVGLDTLVLKNPATRASAKVNLGGHEVPVEGPDVPPGVTLVVTRKGPYSFQSVEKLNGTAVRNAEFTVAKDGKSMTEVGGAPGDDPTTVVWEKQEGAAATPAPAHHHSQPVLPTPQSN
jgi:hypothetical protein